MHSEFENPDCPGWSAGPLVDRPVLFKRLPWDVGWPIVWPVSCLAGCLASLERLCWVAVWPTRLLTWLAANRMVGTCWTPIGSTSHIRRDNAMLRDTTIFQMHQRVKRELSTRLPHAGWLASGSCRLDSYSAMLLQ